MSNNILFVFEGIRPKTHFAKSLERMFMQDETIIHSVYYSQASIFNQQFINHIKPDNMIAVLSAFPVFIFDYFDTFKIKKIIAN